jgi:ABC-2 type transport system ATP-binding protein
MSSTEAPVLELADLSKSYGRGERAVHAVRHVSLTIGAGEVYGFLGPNGAGKSTTIRMLLGLISPTGGEARLFGQAIATDTSVLRRVGSLVDGGNFYPFLSGRRNLEVLARTHGSGEDRIDALLDQVGLSGDSGRKVKGYSTGMRQRLGVAAALLNDPDIVILDEPPTASTPPVSRRCVS